MIIAIGGVFVTVASWLGIYCISQFVYLINFLSGLEVLISKQSIRSDYDGAQPSIPSENGGNSKPHRLQKDCRNRLVSLNNWKKKWNDAGVEKYTNLLF